MAIEVKKESFERRVFNPDMSAAHPLSPKKFAIQLLSECYLLLPLLRVLDAADRDHRTRKRKCARTTTTFCTIMR